MSKGKFLRNGLLVLCGVLLAGAVAIVASEIALSPADDAALKTIRDSYKMALNSVAQPNSTAIDNFLAQHASPDFKATVVTGQELSGVREYKDYLEKMKTLIGLDSPTGPKGRYELQDVTTIARYMTGDMVVSVGTTKEVVQAVTKDGKGKAVLGAALHFTSLWTAVLDKSGGNWKIKWAHATVTSGISEDRLAQIKQLASAALGK